MLEGIYTPVKHLMPYQVPAPSILNINLMCENSLLPSPLTK
jgi:hypothetical protein